MRSLDEVRDRSLGLIHHMLTRPTLWAIDARDLEFMVGSEIRLLRFLEGSNDDGGMRERLHRYGKIGIVGPFVALLGKSYRCHSVAAAVLAHEAQRLGYFLPSPTVAKELFDLVRADLHERFDEVDLRLSEVANLMGEPTFTLGNEVLAYGTSDPADGWIFFCFDTQPVADPYVPGSGKHSSTNIVDPLLRFTWTSEGPFEETFALTTYTKLQVWGSGWDWNHSWRSKGAPPGVREQLQAIHEADPSQHLDRPRFAT